jgi:phospholipase C
MRTTKLKNSLRSTAAILAVAATVTSAGSVAAENSLLGFISDLGLAHTPANEAKTATPIKHLVVLFNENRSFDHYFGTYPNALNPEGEPAFKAARNTPIPNNYESNPTLLFNNPNLNAANNVPAAAGKAANTASMASNPFRLDRTQANTASQSHNYSNEQKAYDGGKNDLFPLDVGTAGIFAGAGAFGSKAQTMGYFDGNTVTAFWNYAQHFAMSDNAWTDNFGPSTPGLLNMFSGQTNGVINVVGTNGIADGQGGITLISDTDPGNDLCSSTTHTVMMQGKSVGDLLNAANIQWGSFVGGFNLQTVNANGTTGCARSTFGTVVGGNVPDYIPHHIWFQYFAGTANPTHARPLASPAAYGFTKIPGTQTVDPANHAYDLNDFTDALKAGNFPSVSFIKLPAVQDAHPGNSDPLDEQTGVVNLINMLQQQPDWKSTAVIIAYDDSDGWYDHAFASPTRGSFSTSDFLNGTGVCGAPGTEPVGVNGLPVAGRCGPGTRTPFLVISPFAKRNFISHTFITQASVTRFIEDNWLRGERLGHGSFDADPMTGSIMDMFDFDQLVLNFDERKLVLDPTMGTVVSSTPRF